MATTVKPPSDWSVELGDDFAREFDDLEEDVQDGLLAAAKAVRLAGPKAGRPHVDTLKGSKHADADKRFDKHLKALQPNKQARST